MSEKEIDEHTGIETTGHSWDGIKELNNPLPRWWLIIFWVSIIWSVVYWVLMPSWPGVTGHLKGVRNHSERENVEVAMATLEEQRSEQMQRVLAVDNISEIENDPDLLQYAMVAGESIFGDNCATCHGGGGQGFVGYPNLVDDDWIWGGSFDAIQQTLHYGIRSTHPQTRYNLMQAYGRDGLLTGDQIDDLVEYVISLSGGEADSAAVERAAPVFAQQCTICHGADGRGDQAQGAPNLADAIWLYGGDRVSIQETIYQGRGGVMPPWTDRLSDEQIKALAIYVHSLGGGE
ncbi:MAG: cytochrome-c oxidase, cbb3-type subunit III [Pseudomonadota bacterium]